MKLDDIKDNTKEGKLLIAILADVTSRSKNPDKKRPDGTWHPDDALSYYEKLAKEIYDIKEL